MLNESSVIGIILLIVFSAACLYLYSHITYLTKKINYMESVVVDMRMAIDTLMTEDLTAAAAAVEGRAAPVSSVAEVTAAAPSANADADSQFYSNVLEEAHEAAPPVVSAAAQAADSGIQGIEAALESFKDDFGVDTADHGNLGGSDLNTALPATTIPLEEDAAAVLESIGTETIVEQVEPVATKVRPNYNAMTRSELTALAEQQGLRVKKSMSRSEIVSLLRRSEPKEIQSQATGVATENAAGADDEFIPLASD